MAYFIELDLASKDPVDAESIGHDRRHSKAGDGEHDGEGRLRAGGVVDGETVSRDGSWNRPGWDLTRPAL